MHMHHKHHTRAIHERCSVKNTRFYKPRHVVGGVDGVGVREPAVGRHVTQARQRQRRNHLGDEVAVDVDLQYAVRRDGKVEGGKHKHNLVGLCVDVMHGRVLQRHMDVEVGAKASTSKIDSSKTAG